jgi:hypothetical protein
LDHLGSPMTYRSYITNGHIVLLEWADDTWIPSKKALDAFEKGDTRIHWKHDVFITSGTISREWPVLHSVNEIRRIRGAIGIPLECLSQDPPDIHTEPLPKHVQQILLRDAQATKQTCPISLEPITTSNGSVTSCGHVFTKSALHEWKKTRNTCPECRSPEKK